MLRTPLLIVLALGALPLRAELVRLDIESTKPWQNGRFEKLQGRAHFLIDPHSAANRPIADISLAPVNAAGKIEFDTDFVIVRPANLRKSRHAAVVEIPNRGVTQANGSFFLASTFPLLQLDNAKLADAFVFDQGFTFAWLGWEFDLAHGEIGARLPRAPVSSVVRESIVAAGGERGRLLGGRNSYCAADSVQPGARVIVKSRMEAAGEALPRSAFVFARVENGALVPDACAIFFREALQAGHIYDVVYEGEHPVIAGLGLAAVRDFASYLKKDGSVTRVLGYGYSQSGRLLRDFLYRGFNVDENGKAAFDGLFIASAGAGRGSFDHRYAMPGVAGNSVLSVFRPVDLPPFDDAGVLRAAVDSATSPKIFYTYSSTEYWARYGSLLYTTTDGTKELPLHSNSRLYFFSGVPHAAGRFPPEKPTAASGSTNAINYARADWAFRALLLDLDDWVSGGRKPPDSVYPHLANLAPREQVRFPQIPGAPFPSWMPQIRHLDFGKDFAKTGIITQEPPIPGELLTTLVPRTDENGNDLGGIAMPEIAAPLGTFTGWNFSRPSLENLDYLAGLLGSFIPFPKTARERVASGDARKSVAERYATRDDYAGRLRTAAESLESRRLLRAEDVDAAVANGLRKWDYFMGR